MRGDRDILDIIIGWIVRPIAARYYRRRLAADDAYYEWKMFNPGRCMYCAYTKWANEEKGQRLKIEAHDCVEGNGPAMPLPRARVL